MGDVEGAAVLDGEGCDLVNIGLGCIGWGDVRAAAVGAVVGLVEGEQVGGG